MVSKTFLLLALAFAVVLLVAAAEHSASTHDNEVEDAKYGRDDHGYNNGGRGGYNNGGGRGRHNNGGRRGGNYCRYGCCGGGRYFKGCRCCSTFAEANAYKQAHETKTHN